MALTLSINILLHSPFTHEPDPKILNQQLVLTQSGPMVTRQTQLSGYHDSIQTGIFFQNLF